MTAPAVDPAAAAATLEQLPDLVFTTRERLGLRLEDVAAATGMARSTISRLETGKGCTTAHAAALLRWLGTVEGASS